MKSKRQQTMAKLKREQEVKERRARKIEKRHAAAAERAAAAADGAAGANTFEEEHSPGTTEPSPAPPVL